MREIIYKPEEKTLGEFLEKRYAGFKIRNGKAPLDMDISHGIEVNYADNRKHGHGEFLSVYPFIRWTDGCYNPCHYWGEEHYLSLEKR